MEFNQLPAEIQYKIFCYSENWKNSVLVCKNWQYLIEQFHIFGKCKFFGSNRSQSDRKILISSNRKYKVVDFTFDKTNRIVLEDVIDFMARTSSTEGVEMTLSESSNNVNVLKLMGALKDIKSLKIVATCEIYLDPNLIRSTIVFGNLRNLEIYFPNRHIRSIDKCLSLVETPNIESFVLKSKYSRFKDLEFGLKFINKYTLMHLMRFDVACFIEGYSHWLEFFWNGAVLKMHGCKDKLIEDEFSKFVTNNCHKFDCLKEYFMYHCSAPENIINLIFSHALNLEALSTDGFAPAASKEHVYKNFKVMKLWSMSNYPGIYHHLSRSFPNIEKMLICEGISEDLDALIKESLKNLRDFRSCMNCEIFHREYPPNVKYFDF